MNAPVLTKDMPHPLGDNNPPEPTPFERCRDEIEAVHAEAGHWLTGAKITSDAEAEAVTKLMGLAQEAGKRADEARKAEKRPHDDAAAEVQGRFNPLIAGLFTASKGPKGKAKHIVDACQAAMTPWREEQERIRAEAARAAREAAEKARREAMLAHHLAEPDSLAEREEADRLDGAAKAAEIAARKASKPVATGLRTSYRAEVTDATEFARWVWKERPDHMRGLLDTLAQRLCDAKVRGMPGVDIHEERVAR